MIVHNEVSRYLTQSLPALLAYCDDVCVWDDASTDGTDEWLRSLQNENENLRVFYGRRTEMFKHEGQARQKLLDWTLTFSPNYIMAIDADEFVANPSALVNAVAFFAPISVFSLEMVEVWDAQPEFLLSREDGGWRSHHVPIVWQAPEIENKHQWEFLDRGLACGRVPARVHSLNTNLTGIQLLHFGWANRSERTSRWKRYDELDRGNFHAKDHLDSIMWPNDQVQVLKRSWSLGLMPFKDEVYRLANEERESS